jgi:hypothetical protein
MTNDPRERPSVAPGEAKAEAINDPATPYRQALINAGLPPTGVVIPNASRPSSHPHASNDGCSSEVVEREARAPGEISAQSVAFIQREVAAQTNEMQSRFILGIAPRIPPASE